MPQNSLFDDYLDGVWGRAEPLLTFGTGMVAEPVAGLSGLFATLAGEDPEVAAGMVEHMREAMTYLPKSEEGRDNLMAVGNFLQPVGDIYTGMQQTSGDFMYNNTGSAAAGAVGSMVPDLLLASFGLPAVRGAFKNVAKDSARFAASGLEDVPDFIRRTNDKYGVPVLPEMEKGIMGYHYGRKGGLTELDPAHHGTGASGAERRYTSYLPDDQKPTFFYLDEGGGVTPEAVVRSGAKSVYQADIPDETLYSLKDDPDGLWKDAMDIVTSQTKYGKPHPSEAMPYFIELLREAGYKGYIGKSAIEGQGVAAVYGKTPVTEMPEGFGMGPEGVSPEVVGYHASDRPIDQFQTGDLGFHFAANRDLASNASKLAGNRGDVVAGYSLKGNIVEIDDIHGNMRPDDLIQSLRSRGHITQEQASDALDHFDLMEDDYDVFEQAAIDDLEAKGIWSNDAAALWRHAQLLEMQKYMKDWGIDGVKYWNEYDAYGDAIRFKGTPEFDKIKDEGVQPDWSYMMFDNSRIMKQPDLDLLGDIPPPPRAAARGQGSSANIGRKRNRVGTTGKYVGAPIGMDSPQKLGAMRSRYMDTAVKGVGGRDWYNDSSDWILGSTPDTIRAKQIADSLGITSQGTGVDTNLGFTLKALVQDATGQPIDTGRFPKDQSPLITEVLAGHNPDLGPKRTPFAENLSVTWNPSIENRPVHDIWQGRAMGYKTKSGKPWDAGFSPQQHGFMDEQMDIINARLNELGAEGFTDWDNLKTQAAAWTGEKINSGSLAPEDAALHYGDFADKYRASGTHEAITGVGTGHLEGLAKAPAEVRQRYSDDKASLWEDDKGRDILYSDVGLLTEPTDAAQGVYRAAGGEMEFNPARSANPLLNIVTEGGTRQVSPEGRAIMDAVEGTRAAMDAQNAGAWHKLITGNKAGSNSSLAITMDNRITSEDMAKLADFAERNGMFAVDTGRGISLINDPWSEAGKARTGVTLGKDLKKAFGNELKSILPEGAKYDRVTADTGYIDYLDAWRAGEGSGEVTRKLQSLFDNQPELLNRLDQSEGLRKKALQKLERDEKYAKKSNLPIREDLQTARRIVARDGLKGLFRALGEGVALPAVVLGLAPMMLEESGAGTD